MPQYTEEQLQNGQFDTYGDFTYNPGYNPSAGQTPTTSLNGTAQDPLADEPTASNGFGAGFDFSGYDSGGNSQAEQMLLDRYNQSQNYDPEQIRRNATGRFQTEIDSVNALFNNMIAEAKTAGQNRLGQNRARQNKGGLIGSERGAAQVEGVVDVNKKELAAIEADRAARVSGIMNQAESIAQNEISQKAQAASQGADAYINFLAGKEQRAQENTTNYINALVTSGTTLDEIGQENIIQIAKSLGVPPQQVVATYKAQEKLIADQKAATDAENAFKDKEFALKQQEANQFNLSEGEAQYVYDPITGETKVLASKAKTYAPKSGSGGGSGGFNVSPGQSITGGKGTSASELAAMGINPEILVATALKGFGGTGGERETLRNEILQSGDFLGEVLNLGIGRLNTEKGTAYEETYTSVIPQLTQAIGIIEGSDIEFGNIKNTLKNFARTLGKDSPEYEQIKFLLEGVNAPIRNSIFGASLTSNEQSASNAFLIDTKKDSKEAILNKSRGLMATRDMAASRSALIAAGIGQPTINKLVQAGYIPSYVDYLNTYGVNPDFIPASLTTNKNFASAKGGTNNGNSGTSSSGITYTIE